jgi:hypothetical protein
VNRPKVEHFDVVINGIHAAKVHSGHLVQFGSPTFWNDPDTGQHAIFLQGPHLASLGRRLRGRRVGYGMMLPHNSMFRNPLPVIRDDRPAVTLATAKSKIQAYRQVHCCAPDMTTTNQRILVAICSLNFASDVTVTLSFAWPGNSGHSTLKTWRQLDIVWFAVGD